MSEQPKYIAVIHSVSKGKCSFTGKSCDGAIVSFHDGSIRQQMLSWAMLRKLLQFKEQANAHAQTSGQQAQRES